ncbi:hypothetical protein ACGC1H_005432 [Rhizoctonia solani]
MFTRQRSRDATEATSPDYPDRLHSILFQVFTQSKYFKRAGKRELCYKCQLCNNSGVYVHGWMTEWSLVMHQSSSLKHLGMFKTFERYMKVVEEVKYWARRTYIEQMYKEKRQYGIGMAQPEAPIQQQQAKLESLSNVQGRATGHGYEHAQASSQDDKSQLLGRLVELALKNPIPHISSDLIATCSINWTLRLNALKGLKWATETLRVGEATRLNALKGLKWATETLRVGEATMETIKPAGLETRQVGPVPRRPRPTSLSVILNPSSPPHQPLHRGGTSTLEEEGYERGDINLVFGMEALTSRSQTTTPSLVDNGSPHHKQDHASVSNRSYPYVPFPTSGHKQRFEESCETSSSRLSPGSVSNPELTPKTRVDHKDYVGCVWCGRPNTPTRGDGTCSKNFPMRHHDELILDL